MNRLEREALVERYLACEMKADEERTFMMQVATEPELFETLRAYRYMEHTLRGDSNRLLATDRLDERAVGIFATLPIPAVTPGSAGEATPSRFFWRSGMLNLSMTAIVAGSLGYFGHAALSSNEPAPPAERVASVQHRPLPAPLSIPSPVMAEMRQPDTAVAAGALALVQPQTTEPEELQVSTGAQQAPLRARDERGKHPIATAQRVQSGVEQNTTTAPSLADSSSLFARTLATRPSNTIIRTKKKDSINVPTKILPPTQTP